MRLIGPSTLPAVTGMILLAVVVFCVAPPANSQTLVPFVGCPSDGQVGPLEAPKDKGKLLPISSAQASRLTFYRAENGPGVVGPRGWHCFGVYGSNGSSLFVSPEVLDSKTFFGNDWKGFTGNAIQLSISIGDTSGRFEVARMIARIFPARRKYLDDVVAEHLQPARDFPAGPYPKDQMIHRSRDIVEFKTPANSEGLGTQSRLLPNEEPIRGVMILVGDTPDLVSLSMRMPAEFKELEPIVIQGVESDSVKINQ